MKDQIIKFLAYNGKISVVCCSTTNLVEKARILHDLSPLSTAAMGRILTITSLIGSEMKNETDKLTIQIKGNGPIGKIVAVADSTPKVKACITNPQVELPLNEFGKLDVGGGIGNEGFINVIKDIGLKEPYIGISPLTSGEIAEDFANYFQTSEQKQTAVALGVLVDKNGVRSSGGYIISPMPDATDEEITKVGEQLQQIEGVNKITFVSKDEALDIMQEKVGEKSYLLAGYEKNNFLPASYKVTLTDLKLASKVESQINQLDNIKRITSSNETITKLIGIANGVRIVTAAILIGLIVGSIFIIANTIKLTVYARRREISIMKYVGATNSFIRWPFIVEGMIIGIISAGISVLLVGGIYKVVAAKLMESSLITSLGITLVGFSDMFTLIILVYLALGIGIGVIGSALSMRKYLEV